MNPRDPNEDLFESSRMSFGEHLEELRTVLVRALIGVAVGCVFGFLMADQVVRILTEPLERAQIQFEREDAELRLQGEFGYVPPEYMPLLEEGYVPRAGFVDPGQLVKAIQSVIPGFEDQVDLDPYGFRAEHFETDQLSALCQRLAEQDATDPAVADRLNAVWEQLTSAEQARFGEIASAPDEDPEANLAPVLDTFNRLSKSEALIQHPAFADVLTPPEQGWSTMFVEPKAKPLADLKSTLDDPKTPIIDRPNVQRRLNRALLISLFPAQTRRVRLDVKPLEFWELIDYQPQALGVGESFFVWLKAGLFTGLTIAGPWVFFQLWSFVATGLYPHEKKYIHYFLPISILLFIGGVLLAFFFVFEPVLAFLFSFNRSLGIAPEMRIGEWLGFAMFLPLGFGVAFQLPLVMLFANRIGLIEISTYLKNWRIAVMIIFVLAMFLTPADPISLLLLAVPLTVLYFLGIGMCYWMPRHENPFGDEVPPAR